MSVNLETETRLHIHADQGHVIAVRGDELAPEFCTPGTVAFIRTDGAWLSREDAAKLGRFLLEAAGEVAP
jgi:hypothetical protein